MCIDVNGFIVGLLPAGSGGAVDPLELANTTPTAPAADKVKVFGRKVGGRMMPAFIGPSGLDSSLQASFARNSIAFARPIGNTNTVSTSGIMLSMTGSAQTLNVAPTNHHMAMKHVIYAATVAAATAVGGFYTLHPQYFRGVANSKLGGFHFVCRFGPGTFGTATIAAANATRRGFCGFTSSVANNTDVNPSTIANVLGVGCDNTDTTYQIMHKTGTGAVTKINTGIVKSVADNTEVYELAMFCAPGKTEVHFEVTNLTTGFVFNHTANTNLPAETAMLAPRGYYSVGGTSSTIGFALMSLYIETDY
jgi:hypothetical protein